MTTLPAFLIAAALIVWACLAACVVGAVVRRADDEDAKMFRGSGGHDEGAWHKGSSDVPCQIDMRQRGTFTVSGDHE